MKKYKIPVSIETTASHVIGVVECDTLGEFRRKSQELWDSQDCDSPTTNVGNEFDLNDWDLSPMNQSDLKYYKNE